MTIKEVEEQLGITRANVRFYEKEGLLFPKRNPVNDYRDYSMQDIAVLKKIIFLRGLGIPVETIRQLEQGKANLQDVLSSQILTLEQQQAKAEEACRGCRYLLSQQNCSFDGLEIPETLPEKQEGQPGDTLSKLGLFWDKLVVWGFYAIQILYTIFIYPLLPEQIPTEWHGWEAVEYHDKSFIFVYLVLSLLCIYAAKLIVYQWLDARLLRYTDGLSAVLKVGGIGVGFVIQLYTVLYLQGTGIRFSIFFICCAAGYLAVVFLLFLIDKKYRSRA